MVEAAYPEYQLVGETGMTLFDEAYVTKDSDEIARIKSVAARTSAVWQATWDFIGGHRAEGETVVKADGTPLTIGEVKRFVRRELLDRDLEDDAMIFAEGRDGGFPHSRGEADMPLKLGQAIVLTCSRVNWAAAIITTVRAPGRLATRRRKFRKPMIR